MSAVCPICSREMRHDADFCPHCGVPLGGPDTFTPIGRYRTMGYFLQKATDGSPLFRSVLFLIFGTGLTLVSGYTLWNLFQIGGDELMNIGAFVFLGLLFGLTVTWGSVQRLLRPGGRARKRPRNE